jgi:hypothetical protein
VEGRLLEAAGGNRGGRDSPESAGGGVRGDPGVEQRTRGGEGTASGRSDPRSDRAEGVD